MACAAASPPLAPAGHPDEPPSALAVAAYLAEVLTPGQQTRRTPTGYTLLDKGSRITHAVDIALTSHQCWKIKDGYQCSSTVRTTTTPAKGRPRSSLVEISNDYQWRGGRLFSTRLEAMRPQAPGRDEAAPDVEPNRASTFSAERGSQTGPAEPTFRQGSTADRLPSSF